jgi:hypothetical protein
MDFLTEQPRNIKFSVSKINNKIHLIATIVLLKLQLIYFILKVIDT